MAANFNRNLHLDDANSRWKSSVRSFLKLIRDIIDNQIHSFLADGGNECEVVSEGATEEEDSGAENSDVEYE